MRRGGNGCGQSTAFKRVTRLRLHLNLMLELLTSLSGVAVEEGHRFTSDARKKPKNSTAQACAVVALLYRGLDGGCRLHASIAHWHKQTFALNWQSDLSGEAAAAAATRQIKTCHGAGLTNICMINAYRNLV